MKNIPLLFALIFTSIPFCNFAQKDSTLTLATASAYVINMEKGKTAFNQHNYIKAIQYFKIASEKNLISGTPSFWLSWAHYMLRNFGYSIKYAKKAIELDSSNVDKEAYYLIAANYHHLGEVDSAIVYYNKTLKEMSKKKINDLGVERKLKMVEFAVQELKKPIFAEKQTIQGDVNGGTNDYGPVLSVDGQTLYFTSRRNNTHGGGQNPDDGLFFEDIYRAKWDEKSQKWDSVSNFGILEKVNGRGFESMSWLSADQKRAYITVNNEAVTEKPKTNSSDIFEILYNDKKKLWDKPRESSTAMINSTGFDACATLTADGNTLYFVSDRNLKRGSDVFVSVKDGKNWGIPVRLPDNINTLGNETTPYITPDGKYLFFSSDGLLSMGGYDIFVTKNLGNGKWSDPVNLGATINSVNDDTHFQYYPKFHKAMFAKRTISNMKSDIDIYELDMNNFKFPE